MLVNSLIFFARSVSTSCRPEPLSIGLFIERFLLLSRIPLQCPRNALDPIRSPPRHWQDTREWEPRRANRHIVTRLKLNSFPTIEARP
jgi:hypothetical protein